MIPLQCSPYYTLCADGSQCVGNYFLCDGENKCQDNSDESNCGSCSDDQWQCKQNLNSTMAQCIDKSFVCNGRIDCIDASDEINCNECTEGLWKCQTAPVNSTSLRCISQKWVCDGEDDCMDASDESNCSMVVQRHLTDETTTGLDTEVWLIVLGVFCVVFLVATVIVTIMMCRYRKRYKALAGKDQQKDTQTKPPQSTSPEVIYENKDDGGACAVRYSATPQLKPATQHNKTESTEEEIYDDVGDPEEDYIEIIDSKVEDDDEAYEIPSPAMKKKPFPKTSFPRK